MNPESWDAPFPSLVSVRVQWEKQPRFLSVIFLSSFCLVNTKLTIKREEMPFVICWTLFTFVLNGLLGNGPQTVWCAGQLPFSLLWYSSNSLCHTQDLETKQARLIFEKLSPKPDQFYWYLRVKENGVCLFWLSRDH